jgi:hypothetical protein
MKIDIVRPQGQRLVFNRPKDLKEFLTNEELEGNDANFELTALDGSYKALIIDCYDFGLKVDRTIVFDDQDEITTLELNEVADFENIFPCELKRIDKHKIKIIIEIDE